MAFHDWCYRITCEATPVGVSGKAVNTFHVVTPEAASDSLLTQILNDIKPLYAAATTYINGNWSIGSRVLELTSAGDAPRIRNVPAVVQNLSSSSPTAAQLAAVMSWRTDVAGPAFRGRTFFGGLNAAAVAGQQLNSTFTNAMNAAASTMLTAIAGHTGFGGGLVVRSYTRELDTFVTSAFMNSKIDTLRRRA